MALKKKARTAKTGKSPSKSGKAAKPSMKKSPAKAAPSNASRAKRTSSASVAKPAGRQARPTGKKTMKKTATAPKRSKGTKAGVRRTATASVVDLDVMPDAGEIERRIAERAYLLWCERGGDETWNWLEAERLVVSELGSAR